MTDDERKEYLEFLKHALEIQSRYHDHKETMAWLATALFLGAVFLPRLLDYGKY